MANNEPKSSAKVFSRIRVERVSEKVAGELKKAIGDGIFRVGERLPPERELAEQMGVSRPSVREAIQSLEIQGIIETVHGGGSIVRNITEQEIRKPIEIFLEGDKQKILELTEVRAFMDTWAARQAAQNRTEEELKAIQAYLEDMERDFDKGRIQPEIDVKFHSQIAAAAHNTIFLHLISNIYQMIRYSIEVHWEQVLVEREAQKRIVTHHRNIFEAIRAGDPDAAEFAMNEHIRFVIEQFRNVLMA
jgi:GntR family transcriptional repressor for pyruvate dehydrogenase complex